MKDYDFIRGGFRFRITDEDALCWDILEGKCIVKYTKHAWWKALEFKGDYQQDYTRCEYDCTGSTEVRISVRRKKSRIIIKYRESRDI